jgi:hypothetical protein
MKIETDLPKKPNFKKAESLLIDLQKTYIINDAK